MSLLQLLTTGKSLVGSKESTGRYHLSRHRLLPRFGGKKDPFRATTLPDHAQRPATAPAQVAPSPNGPEAPLRAKSSMEETREPGWAGNCLSKMGALFSRHRKKVERPAIPRFGKPLVQGELSLDAVKVVRNDLHDSDLEFVPAKPVQARPVPATPSKGGAGPEKVWNRVTGRFFGAGKV